MLQRIWLSSWDRPSPLNFTSRSSREIRREAREIKREMKKQAAAKDQIRKSLGNIAKNHPDKVAEALRRWLINSNDKPFDEYDRDENLN